MIWPTKDPDETWEITINWLPQLEIDGDTIVGSSWVVDPGLAITLESFTTTTAVAWFENGIHGFLYEVVNTITTANGRTWVGRMKVRVRNRYLIIDAP